MELCVAKPSERGATWSDWRALAAACEEHGVPELYSSDHYGSIRPAEPGSRHGA
jgi:hypothetical protein